jgi:hypothetical protein
MYEQEDETQQEDERIIPSHALRWSRSLTNFHDVEDEDDLSTGKKKSARTSLRKTNSGGELGSRVDAPQKPNCRPPRARITNDKGFGGTCPLPSPCVRIEEMEKPTLLWNCVSGLSSSPLTDVVVCAIYRQSKRWASQKARSLMAWRPKASHACKKAKSPWCSRHSLSGDNDNSFNQLE